MPRRKLKLKIEEFSKKEIASPLPLENQLIIGIDSGVVNVGVCLLFPATYFMDDRKNLIFSIKLYKISLTDQQDFIFKIIQEFSHILDEFLKKYYPASIALVIEDYPFLARSKQIFQTAEVTGSLIATARLKIPQSTIKIVKINPLHARVIACGSKSEDEARKVALSYLQNQKITSSFSNHEIDAFLVANSYLVDNYQCGLAKKIPFHIILVNDD
jgi:hypothetical protein